MKRIINYSLNTIQLIIIKISFCGTEIYDGFKKEVIDHVKNNSIKKSVINITSKCIQMNDNEKIIRECELKNYICDIDKISLLSIIISIVVAFIKNFFDGNWISWIYSVLFIIFALVVIEVTVYYKYCKLYLEVIKNTDKLVKIIDENINNCIENSESNYCNKEKNNKPILWIIFVFIGILVVLIIKGREHVSYDGLYSFLGGIFGGIVTLFTVLHTISYNKKSQSILRHDAIKPYINAFHLTGALSQDTLKDKAKYDFVYSPQDNKFFKKVNFHISNNLFSRELVIENIGEGIATELIIKIIDDKNNSYSLDDIIALGAGKTEIYRFLIDKQYMNIGKYKMVFRYKDVLRKEYIQGIEFEIVKDSDPDIEVNLKDFLRISPQKEVK